MPNRYVMRNPVSIHFSRLPKEVVAARWEAGAKSLEDVKGLLHPGEKLGPIDRSTGEMGIVSSKSYPVGLPHGHWLFRSLWEHAPFHTLPHHDFCSAYEPMPLETAQEGKPLVEVFAEQEGSLRTVAFVKRLQALCLEFRVKELTATAHLDGDARRLSVSVRGELAQDPITEAHWRTAASFVLPSTIPLPTIYGREEPGAVEEWAGGLAGEHVEP